MGLVGDLMLRFTTCRCVIAIAEQFRLAGALGQGGGERPEVALTFDDGPHPQWTPKILDALDRASLKATFFVVGRSVVACTDLVVEAHRRGHEIGSHLFSHRRETVLDGALFDEEIFKSKNQIEELLVEPVRWLRFPYGKRGRQDPRRIRGKYGLQAVHWTYSSHDTMMTEPGAIVSRIAAGLRPGAIVLMHDALADEGEIASPYIASREATLAAIPLIGSLLAKHRFSAVTLSTLFQTKQTLEKPRI